MNNLIKHFQKHFWIVLRDGSQKAFCQAAARAVVRSESRAVQLGHGVPDLVVRIVEHGHAVIYFLDAEVAGMRKEYAFVKRVNVLGA